MKPLALSTIFTVALPSTVRRMPFSVGTEAFKISSVPSGWTRTATVPGFALETGISTSVSPAFFGSSTLTVGAVPELRLASTSTGALTGSPDFFASSTALSLSLAFISVLPFLSVFTVPVLPSLAVVVWVTVPSLRVSVLVVEPSALFFVSVLIMGLLS